jgi:hypothetical protein
MLLEDVITVEKTVKLIVYDYKSMGIANFGDWLRYYDETIDEVVKFVDDFCDKVKEGKFDKIEQWEKVVMLNSLAIYMIEMDINVVPSGDLMNKILKIYVETIRHYKLKKMGYLKLMGTVLISDISLHKFIKI